MKEKLLITKTDFEPFVHLGSNLDAAKLDIAIQEAQILDLRPVLGDAFYLDFIDKVFNDGAAEYSDYQNLLFGTTYTYSGETIKYYGIVPMLVYYSWARYLLTGNMQSTRSGIVQKNTAESVQAQSEDIRRMSRREEGKAGAYQRDVVLFLEQNRATYPLYLKGFSRTPQKRGVFRLHNASTRQKDGRIVRNSGFYKNNKFPEQD